MIGPIKIPKRLVTGEGHAPAYLMGMVEAVNLIYSFNKIGPKNADINQVCNDILVRIDKAQDDLENRGS